MSTYREMLRDPRWQKKRLEIMQRDGFACRACSATHKTLNVHHTIYREYGTPPWEYESRVLVTFCEECHKEEEKWKAQCDESIVETFRSAGATNSDLDLISNLIYSMVMEEKKDGDSIRRVKEAVSKAWSEMLEENPK